MKPFVLSEKLYKLCIFISLIYMFTIFSLVSYFFYQKVLVELDFVLPDKSVFIKSADNIYLNNVVVNNKSSLESVLNPGNKQELYDLLSFYTDKINLEKIEKEIVEKLYLRDFYEKVGFITFEKIQGNTINTPHSKNLTQSSFVGIIEKSKVLTFFSINNTSLSKSNYYDIYVVYNENNKIKDLKISENIDMINIVENKNVLNYIVNNNISIYNYISSDILNSPLISNLRNGDIKNINVIGSKFVGKDLLCVITINGDKYEILIHNKMITKFNRN